MKKNAFKMMGKATLVALALGMLTVYSSCSFSEKGGDSTAIYNSLQFSPAELKEKPFTGIDVETVADVYYTQNNGDKQEVRLDFSAMKDEKFKEEFQKKAKVIYRDGKVIIGLSGKIKGISDVKKSERMRVYVTSPDLLKVELEGVGSFNCDAINSDSFEIDNEGVGNINIKKLLANKVEITNEGVGSVNLGEVQSDHLAVDLEGVGSVNVDQFKGGLLTIDSEGVGKVVANVDCQKVKAKLEGVGSIRLSGVTRQLEKEKDGVGSFKISDLKVLNK